MSLENYGKYQLVKRLAMGGMAQIYLARRLGPDASDQLVVVKRILPHLGENKEFVQMFLDEAKIAARLAHPNIVEIYDLGAQDDSFFIAMEYIHGEDLRRVCKRGEARGLPLPVPLACRIISDACAGLDYAHKKTDPSGKPLNIVHRDVSPQNILVSFQGRVKVVDFGIAKAADQATVTRSGVLKGKYSYMSPEQAAARRVDCRSDVFALGVVLYELLTGTRLFKRSTDMQTLSAVAECHVTPPSLVSPRVPEDLDGIVMKALAKDPDERYADALQLQVELEEWLAAQEIPATSAELSAFMREVYAERLAREARLGTIVVEDDPPVTGQRTAVEGVGRRRGGGSSNASSKEVTRADRGELIVGAKEQEEEEDERVIEPTAASPARVRPARNIDLRRDSPEPERPRVDRRPSSPRQDTVEPRRPAFDPRGALVVEQPSIVDYGGLSITGSTTGTTQAPRRQRLKRRIVASVVTVLAAATVALYFWISLHPRPQPRTQTVSPPQAVAPAPPAQPLAPVRLETVPSGARVVFEGKLLEGETPLTLPAVPAGNYNVVISREGYQELHAMVAIPSKLDALRLVAAPVQLTLETEPVQAVIFVNGEQRGASPQVVQAKAEQELEVSVSAPQYQPFTKKVKVGAGPSQVERLVLEPLPKAASVPPGKSGRAPESPRAAPEPSAPKALVRFAATPWAEVTCNGRKVGQTPMPDVSLPVGTYQCQFHNPHLKRTLNRRIDVKASILNTVSVKF